MDGAFSDAGPGTRTMLGRGLLATIGVAATVVAGVAVAAIGGAADGAPSASPPAVELPVAIAAPLVVATPIDEPLASSTPASTDGDDLVLAEPAPGTPTGPPAVPPVARPVPSPSDQVVPLTTGGTVDLVERVTTRPDPEPTPEPPAPKAEPAPVAPTTHVEVWRTVTYAVRDVGVVTFRVRGEDVDLLDVDREPGWRPRVVEDSSGRIVVVYSHGRDEVTFDVRALGGDGRWTARTRVVDGGPSSGQAVDAPTSTGKGRKG